MWEGNAIDSCTGWAEGVVGTTERERGREREQGVVGKAYLATKGVREQRHG